MQSSSRDNNSGDARGGTATAAQAVTEPRAPRELRKLSERRASRKQHRTAGLAAASADFWADPTSLRGDRDLDPELSQELLSLRQRMSGQLLEIAARHPNPSFREDEDEDEDDGPEGIEQQIKAASTALQAFPHLRALQSFVHGLHQSTRALDVLLEEEDDHEKEDGPTSTFHHAESARSMDDFWEQIADASPGRRLLVLSDLLAPQTMREFVVAAETFFHIRHLLADEDELYIAAAEAHPLVSQLLLALEDSPPVYLPMICRLLGMFAMHKPLKRLMLQKQTVSLAQTRRRALRDKGAVDALDQLLRALTS